MLDAAGWKMKNGYRYKDGKELALRFTYPAQDTVRTSFAQIIQATLKQVGVKINIVTVPRADFFDKYISVGNFDLCSFQWSVGTTPNSSNESLFLRKQGQNGVSTVRRRSTAW